MACVNEDCVLMSLTVRPVLATTRFTNAVLDFTDMKATMSRGAMLRWAPQRFRRRGAAVSELVAHSSRQEMYVPSTRTDCEGLHQEVPQRHGVTIFPPPIAAVPAALVGIFFASTT